MPMIMLSKTSKEVKNAKKEKNPGDSMHDYTIVTIHIG